MWPRGVNSEMYNPGPPLRTGTWIVGEMTEIRAVPSLIIRVFRGKEGNGLGSRKNQGWVCKDLGPYTIGQQILITERSFSLYTFVWVGPPGMYSLCPSLCRPLSHSC